MEARSQSDRSESSKQEGFCSLRSHCDEVVEAYKEINGQNETHIRWSVYLPKSYFIYGAEDTAGENAKWTLR